MSSELEKFVNDHRDEFDDEVPAPALWNKIRDRMDSVEGKKDMKQVSRVPFLYIKRWLPAAAAVVLVCGSGILYYILHHPKQELPVAINHHQPTAPDTGKQRPDSPREDGTAGQTELSQTRTDQIKKSGEGKSEPSLTPEEADYNEEMYHYTRLVEIKQNELKSLQKDEPLLYKQFSGDVNRLDSVYHLLKTQLPKNSNREQVIEAMISNLQLQIGLLNKQLDIIKQIKHSKKSAYEKAYKSV
jgi:hypothetical protein